MIEQYLQEKAARVHQELDQVTMQIKNIPDPLRESMRYSLLAGGKRLRPVLVLATIEALNEQPEKGLSIACAIEMIHTYSLIHDDLPAMDNDDYRRGKLTNHKVFGDAMAILAGDALLTESFRLITQGAKEANLSAATMAQLVERAVTCAGASGMIGGQVRDTLSEDSQIDLAALEQIHRHKTGDLIAFSVQAGAYIAGANEEIFSALTTFAYQLGLAFQIQDDILDVVGVQELIGKPVGSDEDKKKATYPALIGLEQSREKLFVCTQEAKESIRGLPGLNPERLIDIAEYLLNRDR